MREVKDGYEAETGGFLREKGAEIKWLLTAVEQWFIDVPKDCRFETRTWARQHDIKIELLYFFKNTFLVFLLVHVIENKINVCIHNLS